MKAHQICFQASTFTFISPFTFIHSEFIPCFYFSLSLVKCFSNSSRDGFYTYCSGIDSYLQKILSASPLIHFSWVTTACIQQYSFLQNPFVASLSYESHSILQFTSIFFSHIKTITSGTHKFPLLRYNSRTILENIWSGSQCPLEELIRLCFLVGRKKGSFLSLQNLLKSWGSV